MPGQALVEFSLIVPVLMAMILGMVAMFYFDLSHHRMQTGVDVLAQLAAAGTDEWRTKVADEDQRAGCNAMPLEPAVTYPDGDDAPGHRIVLDWACHLATHWLFDGLTVTVSSEAVIREAKQ